MVGFLNAEALTQLSDRVTLFVVRGIAGNRVELMLGRRDHGYVHVHVVDQSENPVSNYAVMILAEAGLGETTYKVSSGSPPIIAALPVGRYKVQLAHVLAGGVALYRARDEASTEVKNTGDVAEVRFKVALGAALAFDIKLHAGMDGGHVEYMKEGGLKVNWTRFRHLMTTEPGYATVSESVSKDGRHTTGVLDPGVYRLRLVDRHDLDKVHWEGSADLQRGEVVTVEIDLSSGEIP